MFGIHWLDPHLLISELNGLALFVILAMVFVETGLLVGFFLPGDSLLFVTGLAVAHGDIQVGGTVVPIWLMCALISLAGFLGDQTGYWIGRRSGHALFNKPNSRLFKHENVEKTHAFFERYGSRAVILAHFVPVMRTFVPVAAGIGEMEYRKFLRYNIIGVIGWGTGVTLLGVFLGGFQVVADHIDLFTIGFVVLSTIPIWIEGLRARRAAKLEEDERKAND
jgi:membrane-associated protein